MVLAPKQPSTEFTLGLDLGTSTSGFSSCAHGGRPCMQSRYPGQPHPYAKTQTVLLYRIGSMDTPVAFGWEATNKFNSMSKAEQQQHVFISRFKMGLDTSNSASSSTQIAELSQQAGDSSQHHGLTTQKLITDFPRLLWKLALEKLQVQWGSVKEESINVVLSVPAAWSDAAKQTMRQAAADAGLASTADSRQLMLVHEPEAAALAVLKQAQSPIALSEGETIIIVDMGGGTADITCHKIIRKNGQLVLSEETYREGVSAGSSFLNALIVDKVRTAVGEELFDSWAERNPADVVKLHHDKVEMQKRAFDGTGDMSIELPISLVKLLSAEKIKELQRLQDGMDDEIIISKQDTCAIFDTSAIPIIEAVQKVLTRAGGKCDHMMLVGGYAESVHMVQTLRERFKNSVQHTVVVPDNPSQAVLAGAAMYGDAPDAIVARRSSLAYGVQSAADFTSKHRPDLRYISPTTGKALCNKLFCPMVQQDELVEHDQAKTRTFTATERGQSKVTFHLFTCKNNSDRYVDADSMKKVSEVTLHIADPSWVINPEHYSFTVTFMLGGSELTITAVDDQTKKEVQTTIVFVAE